MEDDDTLRQVVDRLQERYPDLPRGEIEAAARVEFDELVGRPVHDYLSILTERAARKRLKRDGASASKSGKSGGPRESVGSSEVVSPADPE
jgi:hypothetical protein